MPLIRASAGALLACLWLGIAPTLHAAPQSIWPPQTPHLNVGDYRSVSCPYPPPAAYTGPLQVDSKYDQTDPTKSTLGRTASAQSKEISETVNRYGKMLVRFADHYQTTTKPAHGEQALACLDQWLTTWARRGALLNRDASKTGQAVRKWALASIASTALKTQALSGGQWRPDGLQKRWFEDLATRVLEDYQPRLTPGFAYFNNHDYWAAWAIAASSMLTGRDDHLDWSTQVFERAMGQITPGSREDYAFLPAEVARGKLAANYSHYALVPLVLLNEALLVNGRPPSTADRHKLERLANFASLAVLRPRTLPELSGASQSKVEPYKMAWLIPFLARHPQHAGARELYARQKGMVDGYSQIGGRILALYPGLAAVGARP